MESEPPWKLWYPPAGTTVSVPAAVCRKKETFDEFLANFEEEMDSEEGGKEAKDEKVVEDDEVLEDYEVMEDDEVKEIKYETNTHYSLRSSV